jgi:hypothetical protein
MINLLGYTQSPRGSLAFISMRPKRNSNFPFVLRFPEIKGGRIYEPIPWR